MNYCSGHGFVVSLKRPLPTDPHDFDVGGRTPTVGCNQLRCQRCQCVVRSAPGVEPREFSGWATLLKDHYGVSAQPDAPSQVAALVKVLYDLPEIAASPLVVAAGTARLYVCRCGLWTEYAESPLENSDPAPSDPNMPWRCAGHPEIALPYEFDGAHADSEADLRALCQRALHGETPPGAHADDRRGACWAARLHGRLGGTPWQDAVAAAAAGCLDDPDVDTRARAIQFFALRFGLAVGMRRGVELLQTRPELYRGLANAYADGAADKTLEDSLLSVIMPMAGDDAGARELLRSQVLRAGQGRRAHYYTLAASDTAWLAEHAEEVARATPQQVAALITALSQFAPAGFDARPWVDKLRAQFPQTAAKRR